MKLFIKKRFGIVIKFSNNNYTLRIYVSKPKKKINIYLLKTMNITPRVFLRVL